MIRAALTALVAAGKVRRSGDGTRGNPFVYQSWFSGSQDTPGTREPESREVVQTRMDIAENLVPETSEKANVVPVGKRTELPLEDVEIL